MKITKTFKIYVPNVGHIILTEGNDIRKTDSNYVIYDRLKEVAYAPLNAVIIVVNTEDESV